MNKKILSLAVAAAVAAPMAAQADVKISGAVARDIYSSDGTLVGGDSGTSKLVIDGSNDTGFARMAWDIRQAYGAAATTTTTIKGAKTKPGWGMAQREQEAGLKIGGGAIVVGRQASAYAKAVTIDSMNATFLEARKRPGGTSKVASFNSGMLGYRAKFGGVGINVQYGPAYSDMSGGVAKNPILVGVKAKLGPVDLGVGYQGDTAGNPTTGVRAKMKFGNFGVGVSIESADGNYTGGGSAAGSADSLVFIDGRFGFGGGMSVGAGIGSNTTASTTFYRVDFTMKMGDKSRLYVGLSDSSVANNQRAGLGIRVDL